jgi:SPP1 family predicted phage head-tail adaptor
MRGKLTPLSGAEVFQALQAGHNVTHRINMRFTALFDTTMKLKMWDEAYDRYRYFTPVYNLDPQNRHTQLDILVLETLENS